MNYKLEDALSNIIDNANGIDSNTDTIEVSLLVAVDNIASFDMMHWYKHTDTDDRILVENTLKTILTRKMVFSGNSLTDYIDFSELSAKIHAQDGLADYVFERTSKILRCDSGDTLEAVSMMNIVSGFDPSVAEDEIDKVSSIRTFMSYENLIDELIENILGWPV